MDDYDCLELCLHSLVIFWLEEVPSLGLRQAEPLRITIVARCHGVGTVIYIHAEEIPKFTARFAVQTFMSASCFHACQVRHAAQLQ